MKSLVLTGVGLALSSLALTASAHGCSGNDSCGQGNQRQEQRQVANPVGQANVNTDNSTRSWSVVPVQPITPVVATPSATVSRHAGGECGPRMYIVRRDVRGINNRVMSSEEFEAGTDEYVLPDMEQPYRKVQLSPTVYQLVGHRVAETSAVVSVSTGYAWGVGGNGNSGGGGSLGMGSTGSLQRVITTIRLHECVAATIDETPKPQPPKEVVKWKTRTVVKEKPVLVTPLCKENLCKP